MNDDLEISHGGAIAVDPDELRAVADALLALAPKMSDAAAAVRHALNVLANLPHSYRYVSSLALSSSADHADALYEESLKAGTNTTVMADAYELVERRVELSALSLASSASAGKQSDRVSARIAELEASDPRIAEMADLLIAEWEEKRFEGMDTWSGADAAFRWLGWGLGPGTLSAMALAVGRGGVGRIPPGATLSGSGDPVSVTPVKKTTPTGAPTGLANALRRFPDESGAQIKVEKYTMPDGRKTFVLYEKGTQSVTYGGGEPFDVKSNVELFTRKQSASYVATVEALRQAGAEPGDEVHAYSHSQAGMVTAYLATQSEFDVTVDVSAGNPVHGTPSADRLMVGLRHTDDIVSTLSGGGSPAGDGSSDSVVITRDADLFDTGILAHSFDAYVETAELADASGDVRLEAIRDKWRELDQAVSIESTEYVARRE